MIAGKIEPVRGVVEGTKIGIGIVGIEVSVEKRPADDGVGWNYRSVGAEGGVETNGIGRPGFDFVSAWLTGGPGVIKKNFPTPISVVGISFGKIGVALPAYQGRIGDWDVVCPAIEFDSGVLKRDGRGGSPKG